MYMLEEYRNTLRKLSKDQLIYIIDQFDMCCSLIGETCVEWSKMHIDSDKAIDNVRDYLIQYDVPFYTTDVKNLKNYIDIRMKR